MLFFACLYRFTKGQLYKCKNLTYTLLLLQYMTLVEIAFVNDGSKIKMG